MGKFNKIKRITSLASFTFLLAYLIVSPSATSGMDARKSKYYEYQKRGEKETERYEGIKNEQIAGEHLELLSAVADYRQEPPFAEIETFNLGFYLEQDATVYVTVREYYKGYIMKPTKTEWKKGFNTFSWSAKIARDCNINLYELQAKAIVDDRDSQSIALVPVVLYYSFDNLPKEIIPLKYKFYFVSTQRVDLTINANQQLQEQLPRQIIPIEWKHIDERQCQLELKALFPNPVSGIRKRIDYVYKFNPKPKIPTRDENRK